MLEAGVNNTPKSKHEGPELWKIPAHKSVPTLFDHLKTELPLLIPGNPQIYLPFISSHSRALICLDMDRAGKKTQGVGEAEHG